MPVNFDEQQLSDFSCTFYGYGDYQNPWWFIGMEEGGGNSYEEVSKRLLIWEKYGRSELGFVHTFHQDIGMGEYFQDPPKYQFTWNRLIRILLSASCPDEWEAKTKQDQIKAVQNYQANKLGRTLGNDCLLELLPLPSRSTKEKDWIYRDHTSQLKFRSRKNYKKYYLPIRIQHIKECICRYNPAVVVFYSLKYRKNWERIVGDVFWHNPQHNMYFLQRNTTLFVIIPHPAIKPGYIYFHTIGRVIAYMLQKV